MEQDKISLVEIADGRVVIVRVTPTEVFSVLEFPHWYSFARFIREGYAFVEKNLEKCISSKPVEGTLIEKYIEGIEKLDSV